MTEVCKVRLLHKHNFADSNHKNFIAHYVFSEFRVFIVGKMQLDFYCCLKIQKKPPSSSLKIRRQNCPFIIVLIFILQMWVYPCKNKIIFLSIGSYFLHVLTPVASTFKKQHAQTPPTAKC